MACLHEGIVVAIGRATDCCDTLRSVARPIATIDRCDRSRDRSLRLSHRVNIHVIVAATDRRDDRVYVYTVQSSRRSVARPIAATIAPCKHRVKTVRRRSDDHLTNTIKSQA